jgi:DNA-binding transcriptional MerR regulator
MINPMTKRMIDGSVKSSSRALQLFVPPDNAVLTIETAARLAGVSRRAILVYCKHHLLSPMSNERGEGYSFNSDGIRSLRRIEALRTVCGDDFVGIKIILDLTAAVERLHSDVRLLSRKTTGRSVKENAGNASTIRSRRKSMKSNPRRK